MPVCRSHLYLAVTTLTAFDIPQCLLSTNASIPHKHGHITRCVSSEAPATYALHFRICLSYSLCFAMITGDYLLTGTFQSARACCRLLANIVAGARESAYHLTNRINTTYFGQRSSIDGMCAGVRCMYQMRNTGHVPVLFVMTSIWC